MLKVVTSTANYRPDILETITRALRETRREALEKAARVVETEADPLRASIAKAIRALAESEER